MARIPVYQDQYDKQPMDNSAPALSANAPAAAFGSDGQGLLKAGEGFRNMGATLVTVAAKMRQEKDQADAAAGMTKLYDTTAQPVAEKLNAKNADAVGSVDWWRQQFPQYRDQIAQGLSAGAQRHFNLEAATFFDRKLQTLASHEAEQRRSYQATSNAALADTYGQDSVTQYASPEQREAALGSGVAALASALQAQGIAPDSDAGKAQIAKFQSKYIADWADRAVTNRNFKLARQILADDSGKRLIGTDAEKVEGKLKQEELLGKAMDLASSWQGLSPAQAISAARSIGDKGLGEKAYGLYHSQWTANQQAREIYVKDAIVRGVNTVDQYAQRQDWVGLQGYLDRLPKSSADQLRIQQSVTTYGRQNIDAATGITGRFTKPNDYMGLLQDIGPGGKITSAMQLASDPRAMNVDMRDRKHLEEQLKGNTTLNEHELMNQYKLASGYANSDDPQVKLTADDQMDFMRFKEWAAAQTKDSKQGKDPNYLKSLASQWKLNGETKNWWAPGYGRDRAFGDVVRMSPEDRATWIPDLPEAGSSDRQKLDSKFAQPGFLNSLKRAYKTDSENVAKRMYYRDLLYKNIPMMPSSSIGKGR